MAEQWSASHRDELSEWLTVEPMVSWVTLGHHFGVHQTTVQRERLPRQRSPARSGR